MVKAEALQGSPAERVGRLSANRRDRTDDHKVAVTPDSATGVHDFAGTGSHNLLPQFSCNIDTFLAAAEISNDFAFCRPDPGDPFFIVRTFCCIG